MIFPCYCIRCNFETCRNRMATCYVTKRITYRTITIDGSEFEFSQGFTELHTESYKKILNGEGFRISEARNCIEMVYEIRNAQPIGLKGDYHPLAKLELTKHPFGWK